MKNQNTLDLFEKIDVGLKQAVKRALLQHKQQGQSIHILLDDKIVEIPPEKINAKENVFFD